MNFTIHHELGNDNQITSVPVELTTKPVFEGPGHEATSKLLLSTAFKLVEERHEARTDKLTGLPNELAFDEELERLFRPENKEELARVKLIYVDLDSLKKVNDTEGHGTGDLTIGASSSEIERKLGILRQGEMVARLHGDEMAILLKDRPETEEEVVAKNERFPIDGEFTIERFVNNMNVSAEKLANILRIPEFGISIGASVTHIPGETAKQFKDRADAELYREKERRKSAQVA